MFVIYNFFLSLIIFISPLIILIRIFLGKEDQNRFKEKYGFLAKNNNSNEVVWIHGASVGEILSIIPIIKKFEKDKKIKRILITSSTTSSSQILSKFRFKKTIHQFYPFDLNFLTKHFINHWKPKLAIFVDSEIWPNMFNNLHKKNIPLILLNARITRKSFNRWKFFPNFSKKIFLNLMISLGINDKKVAFFPEKNTDVVFKSARNLPNVNIVVSKNASTYDLLDAEVLLFDKEGIKVLNKQLEV
mgnify:CR=1 FL=1